MRRLLFVLVVVLLTCAAGVAHAQPLGEVLRRPPLYALGQGQSPPYTDDAPPKRDDTALWVFVAAASADWSVTAVCYDIDCGANTKGFAGSIDSPKKATGVGLLIDGAFLYVVREWVQPDHPKVAATLFYTAAVLRVVLVTHKISDLRRRVAPATGG
jgi:hypothetical protein